MKIGVRIIYLLIGLLSSCVTIPAFRGIQNGFKPIFRPKRFSSPPLSSVEVKKDQLFNDPAGSARSGSKQSTRSILLSNSVKVLLRNLRSINLRKGAIRLLLQLSDEQFKLIPPTQLGALAESIIRYQSNEFPVFLEKLTSTQLLTNQWCYILLHLAIKYNKIATMTWFLKEKSGYFYYKESLDPELLIEVFNNYLKLQEIQKITDFYEFLTEKINIMKPKKLKVFQNFISRFIIDNIHAISDDLDIPILLNLYEKSVNSSSSNSAVLFSTPLDNTSSNNHNTPQYLDSLVPIWIDPDSPSLTKAYGKNLAGTKHEEYLFFNAILQRCYFTNNFSLAFSSCQMYMRINQLNYFFPIDVKAEQQQLPETTRYYVKLFTSLLSMYIQKLELESLSPTKRLNYYDRYDSFMKRQVFNNIFLEADSANPVLSNMIFRYLILVELVKQTEALQADALNETILSKSNQEASSRRRRGQLSHVKNEENAASELDNWSDYDTPGSRSFTIFCYLERLRALGHDFDVLSLTLLNKYLKGIAMSNASNSTKLFEIKRNVTTKEVQAVELLNNQSLSSYAMNSSSILTPVFTKMQDVDNGETAPNLVRIPRVFATQVFDYYMKNNYYIPTELQQYALVSNDRLREINLYISPILSKHQMEGDTSTLIKSSKLSALLTELYSFCEECASFQEIIHKGISVSVHAALFKRQILATREGIKRLQSSINLFISDLFHSNNNLFRCDDDLLTVIEFTTFLARYYRKYEESSKKTAFYLLWSTIFHLSYSAGQKKFKILEDSSGLYHSTSWKSYSFDLKLLSEMFHYGLEENLKSNFEKLVIPQVSSSLMSTATVNDYKKFASSQDSRKILSTSMLPFHSLPSFPNPSLLILLASSLHQIVLDRVAKYSDPTAAMKTQYYLQLLNHTHNYIERQFKAFDVYEVELKVENKKEIPAIIYIGSHLLVIRALLLLPRYSYNGELRELILSLLRRVEETLNELIQLPSLTSIPIWNKILFNIKLLRFGYLYIDHQNSPVIEFYQTITTPPSLLPSSSFLYPSSSRSLLKELTLQQKNAFIVNYIASLSNQNNFQASNSFASSPNEEKNNEESINSLPDKHLFQFIETYFDNQLMIKNYEMWPILHNLIFQVCIQYLNFQQRKNISNHDTFLNNDTGSVQFRTMTKEEGVILDRLIYFMNYLKKQKIVIYPKVLRVVSHYYLNTVKQLPKNIQKHFLNQRNSNKTDIDGLTELIGRKNGRIGEHENFNLTTMNEEIEDESSEISIQSSYAGEKIGPFYTKLFEFQQAYKSYLNERPNLYLHYQKKEEERVGEEYLNIWKKSFDRREMNSSIPLNIEPNQSLSETFLQELNEILLIDSAGLESFLHFNP